MLNIRRAKAIVRKLSLVRILKRINFSWPINVNNRKIRIPIIGGLHSEPNEKWMLMLMQYCLPRIQGSFLDVGANKGQNLILLKGVEPARSYIGIDPNPINVYYLLSLIELNRFEFSEVMCFAAGDDLDIARLNFPGRLGTSPAASIAESFDSISNRQSIAVPVLRLDSLAETVLKEKTGILKIDVEGMESAVIRGAFRLIDNDRPLVVFEVLPIKGSKSRKKNQDAIAEILMNLNYQIFKVLRGDRFLLDPYDVDEYHSEERHFDYLGIPVELKPVFENVIQISG